ncbi:TPA: exonuclease SbcC [Vibrio cholerae O1]|nr:exonuclease SbcC [Vibrio cholerae]MVE45279.1 exonuclease SbcC [Vibrio cholerae]HAS6017054.1 exonuclease SbcC [Vibrio cholerae O1]
MDSSDHNVIVTEQLKSIYFKSQNAVLLESGVILTSDYESPAIRQIESISTQKEIQDSLEEQGIRIRIQRAPAKEILRLIEQISDKKNDFAATTVGEGFSENAHDTLQQAIKKRASDIHIELFPNETRIEVRVDGLMMPLQKPIPEFEYGNRLIGYLFNELAINTDGDFYVNKPNNGKIHISLDTPMKDESGNETWVKRDTQWRISYIPANGGGQCTLRWTNAEVEVRTFEQMGWEKGHEELIESFNRSSAGVCLVAGQVGSGKSTTIARCLENLKRQGRSINTIEDPVEYNLGIIQTSINQSEKQDNALFEYARLLLRHDVDIEMHGEVRDHNDALMACRKGETGQLMFSTIHTSSALGIAHTLHEQMGIPTALIAAPNLMKLWVYQTLVRTLCPNCSLDANAAQANLTEKQKQQFSDWLSTQTQPVTDVRFKNPSGCNKCNGGEHGRTALVEMIALDDEDRAFIIKKDWLGWQTALKEKGFKSIADHANLKIRRGLIDLFTASEKVDGLIPVNTRTLYKNLWKE